MTARPPSDQRACASAAAVRVISVRVRATVSTTTTSPSTTPTDRRRAGSHSPPAGGARRRSSSVRRRGSHVFDRGPARRVGRGRRGRPPTWRPRPRRADATRNTGARNRQTSAGRSAGSRPGRPAHDAVDGQREGVARRDGGKAARRAGLRRRAGNAAEPTRRGAKRRMALTVAADTPCTTPRELVRPGRGAERRMAPTTIVRRTSRASCEPCAGPVRLSVRFRPRPRRPASCIERRRRAGPTSARAARRDSLETVEDAHPA